MRRKNIANKAILLSTVTLLVVTGCNVSQRYVPTVVEPIVQPASPTVSARKQADKISWEQACALIRSGKVVYVNQTHSRYVGIVTKDWHEYLTREPSIDAVLYFVKEAPNGKEIEVATE